MRAMMWMVNGDEAIFVCRWYKRIQMSLLISKLSKVYIHPSLGLVDKPLTGSKLDKKTTSQNAG